MPLEHHFKPVRNVGRKQKNFCLDNIWGKMGQLKKYHLKAVRSKMLRNTVLFPFTNSASRVFSHSQNRCHFWKCRIAKTPKKSASFKNTVVLSSYLLIENMCVLNTNYLFSSGFSLGNKNFLVQLWSTSKMGLQKSDSHLGQLFVLFCHLVFNPLSPERWWGTFWNMIRSLCACMCSRLPLLMPEGGASLRNPGLS